MFLNRKKEEDKEVADRQKILAYKRTFGTLEGDLVYKDLLNKFFWLKPANYSYGGSMTASEAALYEKGQRSVMEDILSRVNQDMVEFDRMLKGENKNG